MATSLRDVKLRELGQYMAKNLSMKSLTSGTARLAHAYRAKYVTCKNARLTPFWHALGLCVVLCYMVDYKHLKHDRMRKYH